ncbi:hypothetical protein CYMTET_22210 [Cymbomonas tetramitiformis]|uniref:Protein kinase domain-containing protein n=1 Tax=Cymbomonas tetramitiformis TaxID=36881 RepID=A0AAE0G0C7_9CHLO|nr:hypothetical protein CYMTET_22210 [Cymbomonas tetramitiformis]|eukprot:gene1055-1599_t
MQTIACWLGDESDEGFGRRIMKTVENVLGPTEKKNRADRIHDVKQKLFELSCFEFEGTLTEPSSDCFKGVYRGMHAEQRTRTTLKISEVAVDHIEAIKNLRHFKEENLKAINECVWYQQLRTLHADVDQAIAQVMGVRVIRCPSNWPARTVFICLHMRRYDVDLCTWLRPSDRPSRSGDDDVPLGPGDGYAMAIDESSNDRFNRTLRRVVLHTISFLNWIQRSHGAVHHDMHASNVLLRRHPEDGVLPVFIDFEMMEGRVYGVRPLELNSNDARGDESPPWSGYLFGIYGHGHANGLTSSYDCYRILSDLLHIINLQNLTPYVDTDLLRFVRRRVSARFDEFQAQDLHASSLRAPRCGRYWDMLWQPHLLNFTGDPKNVMMWDDFVRRELENALGSSGKCLRSMIPVESRVNFSRRLHLARAGFALGSPNAWHHVASELDLFLPPGMPTEDMLHNTASMHSTLTRVVTSIICDWDDSSEPYMWQLNRGSRAVTPGAHFVRLHLIQTTMLAFFHWLCAKHTHRLQRRKRKIAEIGDNNDEPVPLPIVTRVDQCEAIAVILGSIVPAKYVVRTLRSASAPKRIESLYGTEVLSNSRVDDWIKNGLIRCMPVPCISVPHNHRDELNTNRQLMTVAQLCTNPSMYRKTPTTPFVEVFTAHAI